jgi:restriction system protein
MDWLGFERLVVDLFQHLGFSARKTSAGADGGVDIELRSHSTPLTAPPQALIQCKAKSSSRVGVDKVRELLGVVTATGAGRGVLVTNTEFTAEARGFAAPVGNLQLGDIQWLLKTIDKLPATTKSILEEKHFAPGYDIPSCVACEVKLKPRNGPKGPFWGCPNYSIPALKCRTTMKVRRFDEVHFLQA